MQVARTIEELRRELKAVKSVVAGDTRYGALALHFIAERLVTIEVALAPRKKRSPTAWQRYFAAGMKAGKPPALIGIDWRAKRLQPQKEG